MQTFITYYHSKEELYSFIDANSIQNTSSTLIQIFISNNRENFIRCLVSELSEVLFNAIMIGSTTDGEIANGEFSRNTTVISFTQFENATLKYAIDMNLDSYTRGQNIASKLLKDDSKLFILFSEGLHTNGEEFLKGVQSKAPNIKVAGGLAGDYASFQKTLVFTKDFILANGAVGVSINSKKLRVFNDYNFNWQKIGKKLTVTKAEGNVVFEIDGRRAVDTYKHYLGEKVIHKIPSICIEFPLLVEENNTLTARAVISASGDGSLTFAANIKEGSEVYFGYGNPEEILKHTQTIPHQLQQFNPEAVFVYSCMARLHFIGPMINKELRPLSKFAPMSGFFTYGEFFSSSSNQFLNQTMTVVAISESEAPKAIENYRDFDNQDIEWNSINALIHLVNKTTQELVEYSSFKEAYAKFEKLFEYSGNAIAVITNDKFVECNHKVPKLFGYDSKKEFLSIDILDVIDEKSKDLFIEKLHKIDQEVKKDQNQEYQIELLAHSKTGRVFWVEVMLTAIYMEEGNLIYVVYRDINTRKEIEYSLQKQRDVLFHKAYHDDLTGLANRKHFMEKLHEKIQITQDKIAVLFIDLDKLKLINDSLGHDIGDIMIKTVASRLQKSIGDGGFVARLGGDEFMIMLYDIKHIKEIEDISKKILYTIQQPIDLGIHTFYSSASIGIAIYPNDSTDETSLLKFSDTAMYEAKEEGGNRYAFYESSMTQKAFEKIKMQEAFVNALRNNEFEIYYLPQYDMQQKCISGVEALIRWNHPKKGFLTPDKFLPYIEKINLLYRLDKWMMNSAIKEFNRWKDMGIAPSKLSLNIRIAELANEQWERKVIKTLKRLGFESKNLELEISEQEIMKHPARVKALLQSMHNQGIGIVIDDFGTGYSSIKQLQSLSIDKIKIDKSLIVDLPKDQEALDMSNIIIAVSRSMGIDIIAEGIESEEQADLLYKNGCRYAQGYYYTKPMKASEVVEYLKVYKNIK